MARRNARNDLDGEFGHLSRALARVNGPARITGGPEARDLLRGQRGRAWTVELAGRALKISIEDEHPCTIEEAMRMVELVPEQYLRGLEIVSEEGKDGVALYKNLDGASGHGGQGYINLTAASPLCILHELGHTIEQRARDADPDVLERWAAAAAADGVSVSAYGDHVCHEDQAEFCRVYSLCFAAGDRHLASLAARSPRRFGLWEHMQGLAGCIDRPLCSF